ncbi:MAG: hypothetical protein M5U19_22970 [Microthrixaceae bacterium]|nr:hypothetical protein [Microthrixaceae bacterium]
MTYLVVGGANTVMQGADHVTTDLDVLPVAEHGNLARLGAAMTELGARLRVSGMSDEEAKALPVQLADGGVFHSAQITNWRTDAGDLDVMLSMPDHDGVRRSYEYYATRAVHGRADDVPVQLAHLADVIASKEHADRDKDREVLPTLRILLASREPQDQDE